MKKSRHIAIVFFTLLSLCVFPARALEVFACEPEWGALARTLGGEQVNVYTATTNQQDPHYIQARPGLIAKARRADLLVCTGAGLEAGWLSPLLQSSGNARIQVGQPGHFMAADFVTLLEKRAMPNPSWGGVHSVGNPHIHLDPVRLQQVAHKLGERLQIIDPTHRAHYRALQEKFMRAWRNKIRQWEEKAKLLQGKSIVVHDAIWIYLRAWAGIKRAGALVPMPGIPPTSTRLRRLSARLQRDTVYRIIYANYQDPDAAELLSQKIGIPATSLDFSPGADEPLTDWFERLLDRLL
uniref:Zinc/manganese transport system substrate-binding protein n=1 Tax=Candidatus Kentrum sp. FW TaxID=2126338 RepID=A0A450SF00_9GAMM|nr:MAG: zinc/manganese transport system substrate-binding protein [Candidatus Kentron sp. FW]VFJ71495.1 MAG: zinc/manganese transport system substrate-binding protein [Candidatus Kentron sp. FW]